MLVHLKPLVSNLFLVVLISQIANAKEIPITQEAEITIPLGKFAVVEFPFKITSKNITSFLLVESNKKEDVNNELDNAITDTPTSTKLKSTIKGKVTTTKSKYISINQNINGFTFFPRKIGVLKMVVWGYDHPILLTIKVSKEDGFGLYQFILPQSDSKYVATTEQGPHEEIINKLMVNLFNQTLPSGYKSNSKDVNFESNGFDLRLNREIVGKKYIGQEWILTNNSNEQANIHEESFYQKNIYGISLEADSLNIGESVRVFIIRSGSEKRSKI